MVDPIGAISLLYDVSKDLYTYYQAWKNCDSDIAELRRQILWHCNLFKAINEALKRPNLAANLRIQVEQAMINCEEATEELQDTLEKIKAKEVPRSTVQKLRAQGCKAIYPFRKSTILGITENLETCREVLHLSIDLLGLDTSAVTLDKLEALDNSLVKGLSNIDDAFQQMIIRDKKAVARVLERHDRLESLLLDEKGEKKAQTIIDSLRFPEIDTRRQHVVDASVATCEWILEETQQAATEDLENPGCRLVDWLRSGRGFFWVRGKPGSGKSTFMKFLLESNRSQELLEEWCGDQKLVIAGHFFWVAGSQIQRSRQGLFQSLLYHIFRLSPHLVPLACGQRWKHDGVQNWSTKELWKSLLAAAKAPGYCFCLFIDGLDECQPNKDHRTLIRELAMLAELPRLKLVVSSRTWKVFQDAFSQSSNQITLEEVNRRDIIHYIKEKMTTASVGQVPEEVDWNAFLRRTAYESKYRHTHLDQLVRDILAKADGVFLWVSLVLDALCERMSNGEDLRSLRKHLDEFPSELEDYFRKLVYDRIPETFRVSETAMALKLQMIFRKYNRISSVLTYFILSRGLQPPDEFILRKNFAYEVQYGAYNNTPDENIIHEACEFIERCCKDLLKSHYIGDVTQSEIEFTHRTIFDFLQTSEMQELVDSHVPDHFHDSYFASQILLASCKTAGKLCWQVELRLVLSLNHGDDDDIDPQPRYLLDMPERLTAHHEQAAIYYMKDWRASEVSDWDIIVRLMTSFILNGRYSYAEQMLKHQPTLVCYRTTFIKPRTDLLSASLFLGNPESRHEKDLEYLALAQWASTNVAMVQWILSFHADPNLRVYPASYYPRRAITVWTTLLAYIEIKERVLELFRNRHMSTCYADITSRYAPFVTSWTKDDFCSVVDDPNMRLVLKLMIEHGAQLDVSATVWKPSLNDRGDIVLRRDLHGDIFTESIVVQEILQNRLPPERFPEWQSILKEYSRPQTVKRLRHARRLAIKDWAPELLTEEDHLLVCMLPNHFSEKASR